MPASVSRRKTREAPNLDPLFSPSQEELLSYECGQCHALALALHQQTGWRLVGSNWSDEKIPEHIFVVDRQGQGVDIHGRWSRGSHPDLAFSADWKPIDESQIRAWVEAEEYAPIDAGRAEYTALLMLGISDTIILPPE